MMKRKTRSVFSFLIALIFLVQAFAELAIPQIAYAQTTSIEEADQKAIEEDVPIESTDVPYKDIEWVGETEELAAETESADADYQIVMVLDVSGSMGGQPITQLRQSCYNFIDDILYSDKKAEIGIVTFDSEVTTYTFGGDYFTDNRSELRSVVSSLSAGSSTAMNAGMKRADELMEQYATAPTKFVIQMADGAPNMGQTYSGSDAKYAGTSYVDPEGNAFTYSGNNYYHSAIYNTFLGMKDSYGIYSLGFFHSLSGTNKQFAATFMNDIQNMGYHEVHNADELVFTFEEIAENISSDFLMLNTNALVLAKGETDQLAVSFTSAYNSPDRTVRWSSDNNSVAKVDQTGQVTAVGEGICEITAAAGGHQNKCIVVVGKENEKPQETIKLYIYENLNGPEKVIPKPVLSKGATVKFDGNTYTTNESGCVSIPKADRGEIEVSKDGYSTTTITCDKLKDGMKVVLQKASPNPVIQNVWVDGQDILTDAYTVNLFEESSTTLTAKIDWGKYKRGKIQLMQKATTVDFPADSNTLSMVLKDKFDVSSAIYMVATNDQGNSVKAKLNFECSQAIKGLDGAGFSIGNSVSLNLPTELPFVGGKKLGLDMATNTIPINVSTDNGKVLITIGVDVDKYTRTDKYATSNATKNRAHVLKKENKVLFDNIKSFASSKEAAKKSLNGIKNIKQKYGTAMKMPQGSFGFTADFTVLGFAEGYVDEDWNFHFLDGGVILNPSVSLDWSGQFAVGPVPCYWEAQIAAAIQAQLNLYKNAGATFLPNGVITGTISGSVGAGIGINKVATIGGGGKLTFKPSTTLYKNSTQNYFSMTTSISLYFKVKIAIFEYKYEPKPIKEWKIDNGVENIEAQTMFEEVDTIYDQQNYSISDLSYLLDTQTSVGEDGAILLRANSYEQTKPQLVSFDDGTKLAVWIDCMENDINKIQLYYATFDGSSWSEPTLVCDDATADFSPNVCVDGNAAYITWQDADRALAQTDTLESLAKATSIKVAAYNNLTKTMEWTEKVSGDDEVLDMMPIVCAEGNKVSVVWVRNTENNWFGTNQANEICVASRADSAWTTEKAYGELSAVVDLTADLQTDGMHVAYSMDADNDFSTMEDMNVYLDGDRVTDRAQRERQPRFADGELFFIGEEAIWQMDALKNITQIPVNGCNAIGQYKVLGNAADHMILYSVSDGLATSFDGVVYDAAENKWGSAISMLDLNGRYTVSDFDAVYTDNNDIMMLCNRTEVSESVSENSVSGNDISDANYGKTDLAIYNVQKTNGMEVTDFTYDPKQIVAGSALPVTLTVKNTGVETIEGITVDVLSENGKKLHAVTISDKILSGETKDITVSFIVEESEIGKEITLCARPKNFTITDSAANTCSIALNYEDLAIAFLEWGSKDDTTATIYGSINNEGFHPAQDVKVTLYAESVEGEKINEYTIPAIPSMKSADISFHVPYSDGAVYYVVVSDTEDEYDTGNNRSFVVFTKRNDSEERVVDSISATLAKSEYQVGDRLDLSGLSVKVVYTDKTTADIGKEVVINTTKVDMNKTGSYAIGLTYEGKSTTVNVTVKEKKQDTPVDQNNGSGNDNTIQPGSNTTPSLVGKTYTSKNLMFKVTADSAKERTVAVTGCGAKAKNQKKISIPSKIVINKASYNVVAVENNAFKNHKKVQTVVIPSSVTSIGKYAFKNCKKLTSVTIGKNVTTIGKGAFTGCSALKKVKVTSKKLKSIGAAAFKGISKKAAFKLPSSKKKAYRKMLKSKKIGYVSSWKL